MNFRELNLRGRMAYGLKCCIALCQIKKADTLGLSPVLYKLCEFTNPSGYFDDWQDEVVALLPSCILDAIGEHGRECRDTRCHAHHLNDAGIFCELAKTCSLVKRTKRTDEEYNMYQVYVTQGDEVLYAIELLYQIGQSEVCDTQISRELSEECLLEILSILKKNDVAIPSLEEFSAHIMDNPQNETEYYGLNFDCSYIIKDGI